MDCEMLSSISLPASLTELRYSAFEGCPNLGEVIIDPENKTFMMGDKALISADGTTLYIYFDSMGGDTYTIPSGVTKIASEAFLDCDKLKSVIIPEGVVGIENNAFCSCNNLESVSIPASVIDCDAPFYACNALDVVSVSQNSPNYQVSDGLLMSKDGTTLIEYLYGVTDGTLVLPEGITTIEPYAFKNHNDIDRIILPQSITSLEGNFSIGEESLQHTIVAIVAPKNSAVYAYAKLYGLHVEVSGN